jgi:glucokinase
MPSTPVLGLDVGGTKIAGGVAILPEGRTIARQTISTEAARGGGAVLQDALQLAGDLMAKAAAHGSPVELIGLGICELVDRSRRLASAYTIRWQDQPVHEKFGALAPFVLEADVRAAAMAEATLGAGRPFQTFLYVTIGTGISCCLMLDGQPYLGAHGATGTMASSPLPVPREDRTSDNDAQDAATNASLGASLEERAAGPALVARFNAGGGRATRGQEVLAAAHEGDRHAIEVVRSAATILGSQIGVLIGTLDPEAVIVGGGLGSAAGLYWDELRTATRRHIWSDHQRALPILQAATGAEAGWLGAALAAWRVHRGPP